MINDSQIVPEDVIMAGLTGTSIGVVLSNANEIMTSVIIVITILYGRERYIKTKIERKLLQKKLEEEED